MEDCSTGNHSVCSLLEWVGSKTIAKRLGKSPLSSSAETELVSMTTNENKIEQKGCGTDCHTKDDNSMFAAAAACPDWEMNSTQRYHLFYLILLVEQRMEHVKSLIKNSKPSDADGEAEIECLESVEKDLQEICVNLKRLRDHDKQAAHMIRWGEDLEDFFTNVETICLELDSLWQQDLDVSPSNQQQYPHIPGTKLQRADNLEPFTLNKLKKDSHGKASTGGHTCQGLSSCSYEEEEMGCSSVEAKASSEEAIVMRPCNVATGGRLSTPHPFPNRRQRIPRPQLPVSVRQSRNCANVSAAAGYEIREAKGSLFTMSNEAMPTLKGASEEAMKRESHLNSLMAEIDTLIEQVGLGRGTPKTGSNNSCVRRSPKYRVENNHQKKRMERKKPAVRKDPFIDEFDKLLESVNND